MEDYQVQETAKVEPPPAKLGELEFGPTNTKPLGGINPHNKTFDIIGQQYFKLLIEHANLTANSKILDIGCGTGRLAKQLAKFLNNNSYIGIDNNIKYIQYCTTTYPDFKFDHLDVQHDEFNPTGKINPESVELPYSDRQFDLVVVMGLFNHFKFRWAAQYMRQISRVLKPRGIFFGTFILLNQVSMGAIESKSTKRPFRFNYRSDEGWYEYQDRQLLNVALPEQALRKVFIRSSLMIKEPIRYGQWCNSQLALTGHDIIIAKKGGWN